MREMIKYGVFWIFAEVFLLDCVKIWNSYVYQVKCIHLETCIPSWNLFRFLSEKGAFLFLKITICCKASSHSDLKRQ